MLQFPFCWAILKLEPTSGLALVLQLWMSDLGYFSKPRLSFDLRAKRRKYEYEAIEIMVQAHGEWLNLRESESQNR